jgi:hypothetical protein
MSNKYNTDKIVAKDIPKNVPQAKVLDAFTKHGHVKQIDFPYNYQRHEAKGSATATYSQKKDQEKCMKSKELTFSGHKVNLTKEKDYSGQGTSKQYKK